MFLIIINIIYYYVICYLTKTVDRRLFASRIILNNDWLSDQIYRSSSQITRNHLKQYVYCWRYYGHSIASGKTTYLYLRLARDKIYVFIFIIAVSNEWQNTLLQWMIILYRIPGHLVQCIYTRQTNFTVISLTNNLVCNFSQ